jgi:hypothetical protein
MQLSLPATDGHQQQQQLRAHLGAEALVQHRDVRALDASAGRGARHQRPAGLAGRRRRSHGQRRSGDGAHGAAVRRDERAAGKPAAAVAPAVDQHGRHGGQDGRPREHGCVEEVVVGQVGQQAPGLGGHDPEPAVGLRSGAVVVELLDQRLAGGRQQRGAAAQLQRLQRAGLALLHLRAAAAAGGCVSGQGATSGGPGDGVRGTHRRLAHRTPGHPPGSKCPPGAPTSRGIGCPAARVRARCPPAAAARRRAAPAGSPRAAPTARRRWCTGTAAPRWSTWGRAAREFRGRALRCIPAG